MRHKRNAGRWLRGGGMLALGLLVSGLATGVAGADPVPLAFNNTDPVFGPPDDPPVVDGTHLYEDVRPGVDALITVVAVDGDLSDATVDRGAADIVGDNVFTSGAFINTLLDNTGLAKKFVTYRLDFQDADTGQPVTVSDIAIAVKDLDGVSGSSGEYVEFAGITSYCVLATGSQIAVTEDVGGVDGKYRFAGEEGQADVDQEEGWVEVFYPAVSSVVVTVGELLGNGARIAQSFDAAGWIPGSQDCTPVTRPSYTLTYDANGATSGTVPSATSGTGELTVASNTGSLAKAPRVFGGWNSKADGTGQSFAAGAKYTPSSDLTLYAQFVKASQTISFPAVTSHPSTGAAPALGDAPFDPTVSATSGLAVTLASTTPAVCTVSGSTVTLLALGDCTLTADQAGDTDYEAAAQVTRTFTVGEPLPPGARPALTCSPGVISTGTPVTCVVTEGDADIDVLWAARRDGGDVRRGVRLDGTGGATFTFAAPAGNGPLTVELVEWDASVQLAAAGSLVPVEVPAGEGPTPTTPAEAVLALAAAGTISLVLRRSLWATGARARRA